MLALALLAVIPLRFHYDVSEFTNAVYHVSCLTGRIPCTNSVFAHFWNEEYHVTRTDGDNLDAWRDTVQKIEGVAPVPPPAPFLANYAGYYPSMRARYRIITTAVESRSPGDFRRRVARFVSSEDAARLSDVLDHFQRRLHPWWVSNGSKAAPTHTRQLRESRQKRDLISQLGAFFEAKFEKPDVFVHAIPGPAPKSKDASATVLLNHFFVEITDQSHPEAIMSVALHELTHALYESAPAPRLLSLINEFAGAKELHAQLLYGLMNEALACAAQGLSGEQEGSRSADGEDEGYHHPYIPRLGRAAVPLLKEALARQRTLFDGFAEAYIRAGAMELKEEVSSPKFVLSTAAVLASEKNQEAAATFFHEIAPVGYAMSEKEWMQFSELNAARLLTYDELAPFAGGIADLESLTSRRGFAYVVSRNTRGRTFLLAGRDTEAIIDVVKRLAALPSAPAEGLIFIQE